MSATLDLETAYRAMHDDVAGRVVEHDAVRVVGPDARAYLQGQVSQDVSTLGVGESAEALLLSPQGKIDSYVRVVPLGADEFLLDVEAGYGEALFERLRRFKIRVKAELELVHHEVVELRGPGALAAAANAGESGVLVVAVSWPGLVGVDLVGPDGAKGAATLPTGVPEVQSSAFEAARIEAGIPSLRAELATPTIPQEAGIIERTVSFTKGCFIGQELVARIDARGGNVPRRLRGVVGDETALRPGTGLIRDGRRLGEVTSVAVSPRLGTVALAYVRREIEPPATLGVGGDDGEESPGGEVRVLVLPLA